MTPTPADFLLHGEFRRQALRTPGAVALREGDRTITYARLQEDAARITELLHARGIGVGAAVGLHMERSIVWVAAVLGILESGAAVVPLPPTFPPGRLREILEFARLDAVIDDAATPLPDPRGTPVVRPDKGAGEEGSREKGNRDGDGDEGRRGGVTSPGSEPVQGAPDRPAFVLCSSGSTGHPKMIVRSHRSFFHRLEWTWGRHPFQPGEVGCQKAHMTTTHSIYELFEPLLRGTEVVIVPDAEVRDLERFWQVVRERSVSRLLIVPSALRASLEIPGFHPPALKVMVLMGEYVDPDLARRAVRAFPPATRIYSIYGSTEASSTLVCDLHEALRSGGELSLGRPISPDVRPLVLGDDMEPVPPDAAGRLHMAGPALFTGYFRSPEETAATFVRVPGEDQPVFDTRDRVRVTPEGALEYLGRVDHTVKVRGYRVGLEEVEGALRTHPGVTGAAVVLKGDGAGAGVLVAFVTPAAVDQESVYRTLRDRLPHYMVPSVLVPLESFPLTPSAKIDRIGLLEEYAHRAAPSSSPPRTTTERRVREVWEAVLGLGTFPLDASFFEVGGTSLTALTLVHRLREAFGADPSALPQQAVYRFPTVEEQAAFLDGDLALDTEGEDGGTPLLVRLRTGTPDQPPLFVISSAGGTLGAYEKLAAALDTSREVLGVRDPLVWGERDPTEGFQRWVGRYLDAILQRQPAGPYHICAYSSAGVFGYEIARRLRQDGHEVRLLALIDPLSMDRSSRWRYGYWALWATWARPPLRGLVRLWGWLRWPFVRLARWVGDRAPESRRALAEEDVQRLGEEDVQRLRDEAVKDLGHLVTFSALLELNTALPFALTRQDFSGRAPHEYLGVLQARVAELMPEVDPGTLEAILVQYPLQVRAQHAYRMAPYDGEVVLLEPATRYAGLIASLVRPHVGRLRAGTVPLGPATGRTKAIADGFGALEAHYRSMRDDDFVRGVAEVLSRRLAAGGRQREQSARPGGS